MEITRRSLLTGKTRTFDLPVTLEQLQRWRSGELCQHVFPHLTSDQREFLMSGITGAEWEALCPDDDSEIEA